MKTFMKSYYSIIWFFVILKALSIVLKSFKGISLPRTYIPFKSYSFIIMGILPDIEETKESLLLKLD